MRNYHASNGNSTFTIQHDEEKDRYATVVDLAEVTPQVRDAMEQGEQNYAGGHERYRQQVRDDWYEGKRGACR
jgi:hypothetical protein